MKSIINKLHKRYYLSISIILLILNACSKPSKLEEALIFAGNNRNELEKVLTHYSENISDSLKYKAACFLIENMPNYYSFHDSIFELYKEKLYNIAIENKFSDSQTLDYAKKEIGEVNFNTLNKVYDSHVISSTYLINNIDLAFRIWEKQPWRKTISFEDFCEYILPYRIGNEPIEDWRQIYNNRFQPLLDSLLIDNDPEKAMRIIFDEISKEPLVFNYHFPMPNQGALTLLHNKFVTCSDLCDLSTYIMRSLSIVGGMDFIIQAPDRGYKSHSWSFLKNFDGKTVRFSLYENRPGENVEDITKLGKVYRRCFSKKNKDHDFLGFPFDVLNENYIDVSSDYFIGNEVRIELKTKQEVVYLCVFDNKNWTPIAWIQPNNKEVIFHNIERDIVYILGIYKNKKIHPISHPFIANPNNVNKYIIADTTHTQTMFLTRKHPKAKWLEWYKNRSVGGKFQGATKADFSDAFTLHEIEKEATMEYETINISISKKFKYLRYLSAPDGHCNMAEVTFFSSEEALPLKGEIIGTEGSFLNNPQRTKKSVFDNDPLTFYDAIEAHGAWSGIKLNSPKSINRIKYIFRNDDNIIRKGDRYELVCFVNNRWRSVSCKTGEKEVLIFEDCPSKALYLLRNLNRGSEERIFTYENREQIWW